LDCKEIFIIFVSLNQKQKEMKCIKCGISIPELPEGATYEEMLCDLCYQIKEEEDNDALVKLTVSQKIDEAFVHAHELFDTKSGDITLEQKLELEELTERLAKLIITQAKQNL
jgi:hypothetical protein